VDGVPPGLEQAARRCLEKDPRDRFHSAHDLRLALETLSGWVPAASGPKSPRRGYPLLAAAGLLVALGALGLWLRSSRVPDSPSTLKITPFTTDGGQKDAPCLSPEGERVAYAWSGASDDNWDIYVKGLGIGARPLRLTQGAANDTLPVWSPDGRRIAFVRELGKHAAIYTVPSLGGQERKLTDIVHPEEASWTGGFFRQGSLSWSADGQWLTFAERESGERPSRVVRFSPATGKREALTTPPDGTQGDFCPVLSPDGGEVAFVRAGARTWGLKDVWVQPVSGGEARRLTREEYDWCHGLSWTPDGRDILFTRPGVVGTTGTVSRVSRTGDRPRPVLGAGDQTGEPTVRGSRMVYVRYKSTEFAIYRVPARLASPGREPQKLIASSQRDTNPAYSPDGGRIAFQSDRGGAGNVWVCDSDGSNPVQLTTLGGGAGTPRWSPDGRSLVFDSPTSGSWDLYVVDAEGGVPRQLTREPSDENVGTWSRDGRFIYFGSNRSGSQQLWKMPAEGGQAVQVTRHGGFYGEESWDGRFVYYSPSDAPSGIWRTPVTGGEETEVVKGEVGWFDWTLGRGGIYYATKHLRVRREEYTVEFLDFASGQVTTVFGEASREQHKWLAVSPDERWLLYRANAFKQSELMLAEGFR
jgi:Tol biopolymer transport system component